MKKIKIISLVVIFLILILIILSFIKLPINALSNERIEYETNGLVSLKSSGSQSLLLLPSPNIELSDSVFSINHSTFKANLIVPKIEFSRSLFNKNDVSLDIKETTLESIQTNLIKNPILLEDDLENLKINILSQKNVTEIKSNIFKYKGADVTFNAQIENNSIQKLNFSIKNLDVNELVLLIDEKYQRYFKQINFSSLNIEGEYTLNTILIEKLELKMDNDTTINLSGTVDTLNYLNSDISITGINFHSKDIFQIIKNLSLNIDYLPITNGLVKIFDIQIKNGELKLNGLDYESALGTKLKLKGNINSFDVLNNNFDIQIQSISSDEIINISKEFLPSNILDNFKIDKLDMIASLTDGQLNISSIELSHNQSLIEVSGELNLYDLNQRNLKISLSNFNQFYLFDLYPRLAEIIESLIIDKANIDLFLSDNDLEVSKFEMIESERIFLTFAGDINLNNLNESFLSFRIDELGLMQIENILKIIDQDDYIKYLNLINFESINGSVFIDLIKKKILIENIDLVKEQEIIGSISGTILDKQFMGLANFQEIDLSKFDQNILGINRLQGMVNIDLNIPEFISANNYKNISGSIKGDINININDDELALVLFMQTLSQDIEDFNQINNLLGTLSKSFINKKISINGLISNVNLNTILIDEIKLISQNGDYLECEVEFNNKDYKLTVLNIIENDDLVIKFQDGKYSYERIIPDGTIRKPLEELIQKNINKLFENLLQ